MNAMKATQIHGSTSKLAKFSRLSLSEATVASVASM